MQPSSPLQTITSSAQLAYLIGLPPARIDDFAYQIPDLQRYQVGLLPKRNGQFRTIAQPALRLKAIQRRLLPLLEQLYWPHSRAHGYIKGRGLRTNAAPHVGKRYVLNVDLADFFGTINFGRIRGRLIAAPYNLSDDVATTITKLCIYGNSLPAGAPTSPILSNMICSPLDTALSQLAKRHGCFYTRYADDITLSSNRRRFPEALAVMDQGDGGVACVAGVELAQTVAAQGFALNHGKTRLLTRSESQEVCGIICNERLNPRQAFRREIRGALHAWRKFGYEEAQREWIEKYSFRSGSDFETSLRGKLQFLIMVRGPNDPMVYKYVSQYNAIRRHERPIDYELVSGWRAELPRTSCCIHSYMMGDSTEMVQGSGFVVEGGLIVTNNHVVSQKNGEPFDVIEVTLPGSIKIEIGVDIVSRDDDRDVAVLRATDESWQQILNQSGCTLAENPPLNGDIVTLTGWPNYNDGDEIHLVSGSVIGHSYPNGVKMFRITPNIVFGNSGGAVFNEDGEVVGVATRGSDVADAPLTVHNGCLPIAVVKDLIDKLPKVSP